MYLPAKTHNECSAKSSLPFCFSWRMPTSRFLHPCSRQCKTFWASCVPLTRLTSLFLNTRAQFKRDKKLPQTKITEFDRGHFVAQLLQVAIGKLKWSDEAEWGTGLPDDDADPAELSELGERRKIFKSALDSIAQLDFARYQTNVHELASNTLAACSRGLSAIDLSWSQAELVLYILYIYPEAVASSGMFQRIGDDTILSASSKRSCAVFTELSSSQRLGQAGASPDSSRLTATHRAGSASRAGPP